MLIDLQLHSTYSDGYLTPSEAAEFAHKLGLKTAALTDHNTVGGTHEFKKACDQFGIKALTGIELYVKFNNRKLNILWYNFDETSGELHDVLRGSQLRRRKLFRAALERLEKHGLQFNINKIIDKYNHYVPLNHVIDDILENKKNVDLIKKELNLKKVSENDMINKYLRNKKVGKLENSYLDINRIFKLRKKIGGQIVLCHPAKHHYIKIDFIAKLKKLGLDGLEVLSPHHSFGAVVHLQEIARELDLIETGGSDFHRFEGSGQLIQKSWDYFKIRTRSLKNIEKIIGE
jgi:3',5'-nucleoside bisphosphate phosphatase